MARKKNNVPSYLLHAQSGQARVRINGREYLLGRFGSEESRVRYGKLVSEACSLSVDPLGKNHNDAESGLSVAELLLAFMRHAGSYYSKDGKKTAEVDCFNSAMRAVRELFALIPARDFSPLNLKAVQKQYVAAGWSRGFANHSTNRVRHIWKWGVGEGLIPVTTWQALQAVPPLKAGHTTAPDYKRREAVSEEHLEKVRGCLGMKRGTRRDQYRDLFDLMLATGARPSELIDLTMANIDTTGEIWVADLADHKNRHRGLARKLFFGPKSQLILRRCPATGPLFPFRHTAFSSRLKQTCLEVGIPPFVPYSLRHTKATELRDNIGIESAQAILGHAQPSMTARYSSKMDKLAIEAARVCG